MSIALGAGFRPPPSQVYYTKYIYIYFTSDFWRVESERTNKPLSFFFPGFPQAVLWRWRSAGITAATGLKVTTFLYLFWLVVWNMNFYDFPYIGNGMSSSQLTFTHIFQRGRYTTNQFLSDAFYGIFWILTKCRVSAAHFDIPRSWLCGPRFSSCLWWQGWGQRFPAVRFDTVTVFGCEVLKHLETSWNIWETSGKHLGNIWEKFRKHLRNCRCSSSLPSPWPQGCFVDCDRGFEEFDKEEELGMVGGG